MQSHTRHNITGCSPHVLLTRLRLRPYTDAEVVVGRKLVASQHLWPRVAVLEHATLAAGPHGLTQGLTRRDGTVEADRREERA